MTLLAHWPLDGDSGDALDYTRNRHHGTVTGMTRGQAGPVGMGAFEFDGVNDYIQIDESVLPNGGEFTVAMWANFANLADDTTLFSTRQDASSTNSDGFDFWYVSGLSGVNARIYDDASSSNTATPGFSASTGQWYHFAAVYDGSDIELWVDGVSEGSATGPYSGTNASNARIGQWVGNTAGKYMDGRIANVRVYKRGLSPEEVDFLYHLGTDNAITTERYTHSSSVKPGLRADVTLDGESATAFIIGSPGTASEESVSTSLSAGSNDYSPTWSASHTEFEVRVTTSRSSVESRVDVNRLALLA